MINYVSERAKSLAPYEPTENKYKIKLDANESFIEIPSEICDLSDCISKIQLNRYPDPFAKDLCIAFGDFINVSYDKIVAGNGSDEIISLLYPSFLNPGDKVLTFSPDFSMYSFYCDIAGMNNVVLKTDENFNINIDNVIKTVKENHIKMVIFSNPCNPTGNIISKSEIKKLLSSVDCLVIVDEAYMDFADESVIDLIDDYKNLMVLKTCSKAIAMAGIRLGFAISNVELISVLKKVKSPFNVNSVTAYIGEKVIKQKDFIKESIDKIKENTKYLNNNLKQFESDNFVIYKTFTNFVFIKAKNAEKIFNYLLGESICVRYMMKNYLRITSGTKEEIDILINSLKKYFEENSYE